MSDGAELSLCQARGQGPWPIESGEIVANIEERRHFNRYRTPGHAYVTFKPNYLQMGQVKNISEWGLLFEYVPHESQLHGFENGMGKEVDIFSMSENFHLSGLPCRVIYDCEVKREEPFFPSIPTRQCGIQFNELEKKDKDLLNAYLDKCESCG